PLADLLVPTATPTTPLPTDTAATTATSPLSLHDALPISLRKQRRPDLLVSGLVEVAGLDSGGHDRFLHGGSDDHRVLQPRQEQQDRKSTRLNSSHVSISYAVFCLKRKNDAARPGPRDDGR